MGNLSTSPEKGATYVVPEKFFRRLMVRAALPHAERVTDRRLVRQGSGATCWVAPELRVPSREGHCRTLDRTEALYEGANWPLGFLPPPDPGSRARAPHGSR